VNESARACAREPERKRVRGRERTIHRGSRVPSCAPVCEGERGCVCLSASLPADIAAPYPARRCAEGDPPVRSLGYKPQPVQAQTHPERHMQSVTVSRLGAGNKHYCVMGPARLTLALPHLGLVVRLMGTAAVASCRLGCFSGGRLTLSGGVK